MVERNFPHEIKFGITGILFFVSFPSCFWLIRRCRFQRQCNLFCKRRTAVQDRKRERAGEREKERAIAICVNLIWLLLTRFVHRHRPAYNHNNKITAYLKRKSGPGVWDHSSKVCVCVMCVYFRICIHIYATLLDFIFFPQWFANWSRKSLLLLCFVLFFVPSYTFTGLAGTNECVCIAKEMCFVLFRKFVSVTNDLSWNCNNDQHFDYKTYSHTLTTHTLRAKMERERNVVSSRERECENRRKRENGMTKTVITLDKDSLLRVRLCVCVRGTRSFFISSTGTRFIFHFYLYQGTL